MSDLTVHTIDLKFQDCPRAIAAYLIPHENGCVLVECGPGSTLQALKDGIIQYGYNLKDVTDLLVTHIHLDHAGAAGWLAQQGIQVHVHRVGAPHLLRPEKLLASAERIYGDKMDMLWGVFLPVPSDKLIIHEDGDLIKIEGLVFHALDTPGHASHHFAYVVGDCCFSGDIGGVRLPGKPHIRIPMPPPEFHLEQWRLSLARLRKVPFKRIALTHFGVYDDPAAHIDRLEREFDHVEQWILEVMPTNPTLDELEKRLLDWSYQRSRALGIPEETITGLETANPTGMSAVGIQRYWKKFREV